MRIRTDDMGMDEGRTMAGAAIFGGALERRIGD